jgi:hypothetical protein
VSVQRRPQKTWSTTWSVNKVWLAKEPCRNITTPFLPLLKIRQLLPFVQTDLTTQPHLSLPRSMLSDISLPELDPSYACLVDI